LKDEVGYLRLHSNYIGISVLVFAGAMAAGFVAASGDPEFVSAWIKEMEMLRWIMELSPPIIMLIIFFKNLLTCTLAVLLGLGLGIVPLLILISNGILLGVVSYSIINTEGALYLVAGILPHGIIELPTVLVCTAIGLRLGSLLLHSLRKEEADLSGATRRAFIFLLRRATPLLFLAAMIETFITTLILSVMV
jgi:stage II sporulation protein M